MRGVKGALAAIRSASLWSDQRTPREIVDKLNKEINAALAEPTIADLGAAIRRFTGSTRQALCRGDQKMG